MKEVQLKSSEYGLERSGREVAVHAVIPLNSLGHSLAARRVLGGLWLAVEPFPLLASSECSYDQILDEGSTSFFFLSLDDSH